MKADHLTFKRAAGVALLGLGLQGLMGLALLIYGIINKEMGVLAGAFMVLSGCIVWLMLAVVFDQHRRERIEAMESEGLAAAGARESSVFGERADELLVAAKRLAWMHKWLVPLVSLVFAGVLSGLGVWRLMRGRDILQHESFRSLDVTGQGWVIALGLAMAFVGFVFARYVSGMAKQPAWANLRAGAAQAVGAALVGLALAVAHFIDYMGSDVVARYMLVAIPVVMLAIAAEVVLNFLLGLYRPRRAGEIPRPAMDSRILGFVAAPDRIAESIGGALNYQFGFDVTGSWFYQLVSRSLTALVLVGLVVMWGLTAIGVVQPNEQGLRIRFGRQVGEKPLGPGAYAKLPWPLERIERFDAATVRRVDLGGDQPKVKNSILWTNDHGVTESYFVVRPSAADVAAGRELEKERAAAGEDEPKSDSPGSDVSLISAEVPLIFEVTDLSKYEQLAAPDQREAILKAIARREVFTYMATQPVDRVIGRGRTEISAALRERVERKLNSLQVPGQPEPGVGVRVLFVGIEGVHPPKETAEGFEGVVQSLQKRQGAIENGTREADTTLTKVAGSVEMARRIIAAIDAVEAATAAGRPAAEQAELAADAERLLTSAGGEAAALLQKAKAERWETHMRARGRAEESAGQSASYRAAPRVYIAQRYFDTLKTLLGGSRVYIVADDGGDRIEIETDLMDAAATGNIFDRPAPKDE